MVFICDGNCDGVFECGEMDGFWLIFTFKVNVNFIYKCDILVSPIKFSGHICRMPCHEGFTWNLSPQIRSGLQ